MDRWMFAWRRLKGRLWFRAALYALVSVAAALLAVVGAPWVPDDMADRLGGESVEQILTILASSLLAVATFSLGAMVTAYTAVSSAATPRAATLVTSDEGTQKSLATFVGAFLYAIVGVTAINANYYGPAGRAIIFLVSLGVVALVAFRLLAWIDRLSSLARVGHMVEVVEARTREALTDRRRRPYLSGRQGILRRGALVVAGATGYVRNVDPQRLQEVAEALDCEVQVIAPPGAFVRRGEPLARVSLETCEDEVRKRFTSAFAVGPTRSFDQDPRFGLIVLGEIATRALSPGVNDPGTAMQVIGVGVRLLHDWARTTPDRPQEHACSRILAPGIEAHDLLNDIMDPIARHGAADAAVMIRLRKGLWSLADGADVFEPAARRMDEHLLARSRRAIAYKPDFTTVEKAAP
jgi:uncharacterized membrane protein